jgi:hypothetical protein
VSNIFLLMLPDFQVFFSKSTKRTKLLDDDLGLIVENDKKKVHMYNGTLILMQGLSAYPDFFSTSRHSQRINSCWKPICDLELCAVFLLFDIIKLYFKMFVGLLKRRVILL